MSNLLNIVNASIITSNMPTAISYCSVDKCETKCHGKGYCLRHYKQVTRHGGIFATIFEPRKAIIEGDIAKLPLGVNAKDGYALVDKEDAYLDQHQWVLVGRYPKSAGSKRGTPVGLHRYVLGDIEGKEIDHINGDPLDCRKVNLRHCSHADNTRNLGNRRNSTTGYKGVAFHKGANKFTARITYNYKNIYLGLYKTAEEASMVYNNKAKELFGEFTREII